LKLKDWTAIDSKGLKAKNDLKFEINKERA
jgi:hypothetical protein